MTQTELRRLILKALCTDDWLFPQLVLKGGNALALAYEVGDRTSLDLDFSIESDFDDLDRVESRIEATLKKSFRDIGIVVFDFSLARRPQFTNDPWWGGYEAEFKLIPIPAAQALQYRTDDMRRQAMTVDPGSQRRKYIIEISKFEYVGDVVEKDLGGFDVRVYSRYCWRQRNCERYYSSIRTMHKSHGIPSAVEREIYMIFGRFRTTFR